LYPWLIAAVVRMVVASDVGGDVGEEDKAAVPALVQVEPVAAGMVACAQEVNGVGSLAERAQCHSLWERCQRLFCQAHRRQPRPLRRSDESLWNWLRRSSVSGTKFLPR